MPSWPKLWALTKRFHQLGIKFSEITLPKLLKWMVGISPPKGHNSKSLSENNPKENKSDISDAYGQQCTSNIFRPNSCQEIKYVFVCGPCLAQIWDKLIIQGSFQPKRHIACGNNIRLIIFWGQTIVEISVCGLSCFWFDGVKLF